MFKPVCGTPFRLAIAVTVWLAPVCPVAVAGSRYRLGMEVKLPALMNTPESSKLSLVSAMASLMWLVTPLATLAVSDSTTVRPSSWVAIAPPPSEMSLLR